MSQFEFILIYSGLDFEVNDFLPGYQAFLPAGIQFVDPFLFYVVIILEIAGSEITQVRVKRSSTFNIFRKCNFFNRLCL